MKVILKNKGVLIFYLAIIVCAYICTWRFQRLEEKPNDYVSKIVLNEK